MEWGFARGAAPRAVVDSMAEWASRPPFGRLPGRRAAGPCPLSRGGVICFWLLLVGCTGSVAAHPAQELIYDDMLMCSFQLQRTHDEIRPVTGNRSCKGQKMYARTWLG